jgi:hypothetical protein
VPARGSFHPFGYVKVWLRGTQHYAHRLVMQRLLGRPLLRGEHVHHKNGIPWDNRPENLQLMTHAAHLGHHLRRHGLLGWCAWCGRPFLNRFSVPLDRARFCGRSHSSKYHVWVLRRYPNPPAMPPRLKVSHAKIWTNNQR